MVLIIALTTGLWFGSNAEFVERVNENAEDGLTWHYVGKTQPNGEPAITIEAQNGEEFVLWQMQ